MSNHQYVSCPSCHAAEINVEAYESMMVLREDTALFTLLCPACSEKVSLVSTIPANLRNEVLCAAIELDAGMGRES